MVAGAGGKDGGKGQHVRPCLPRKGRGDSIRMGGKAFGSGEITLTRRLVRLPCERVKRQATGRVETSTIHILATKPGPRICSQQSENSPVQEGTKHLIRQFTQGETVANQHWGGHSGSLAVRVMQMTATTRHNTSY